MNAKTIKQAVYTGLSQYGNGRDDNHIHASDLPKWCSRRYVLCHKLNRPYHPKKYLGIATALTFSIGKKIEDIVIENLTIAYQSIPDVKVIKEIKFEHKRDSLILTGSLDVGLTYDNIFIPTEVKSIRPDAFDTLETPLLEHTTQLQTYLFLSQQNTTLTGFSTTQNKPIQLDLKHYKSQMGVMVYVCKTEKPDPLKTFDVEYDKEHKKYLMSLLKKVSKSISAKRLPKKICVHQGSSFAKQCPEVNFCFEVD